MCYFLSVYVEGYEDFSTLREVPSVWEYTPVPEVPVRLRETEKNPGLWMTFTRGHCCCDIWHALAPPFKSEETVLAEKRKKLERKARKKQWSLNKLERAWSQTVTQHDRKQEAFLRKRERTKQQLMQCLDDLFTRSSCKRIVLFWYNYNGRIADEPVQVKDRIQLSYEAFAQEHVYQMKENDLIEILLGKPIR